MMREYVLTRANEMATLSGQCACQPSRSPEAFTDVWPSLAASSSLINSTRCSLHDCKRA